MRVVGSRVRAPGRGVPLCAWHVWVVLRTKEGCGDRRTSSITRAIGGYPIVAPDGLVRRRCHRFYACLLCLLGGLDPGSHNVLVVLEPVTHALLGAVRPGLVDLRFHFVDLLLVEREGSEERVSRGVVLAKIHVDYGGDLGRLVEVALEVFRVIEVADVIADVHPVRRPRVEHYGLPL